MYVTYRIYLSAYYLGDKYFEYNMTYTIVDIYIVIYLEKLVIITRVPCFIYKNK